MQDPASCNDSCLAGGTTAASKGARYSTYQRGQIGTVLGDLLQSQQIGLPDK